MRFNVNIYTKHSNGTLVGIKRTDLLKHIQKHLQDKSFIGMKVEISEEKYEDDERIITLPPDQYKRCP